MTAPLPVDAEARLVASGLAFRFPGTSASARPAVNDVSLSLRGGEAVALVGESGSGKSTVGRMIVGLLEPTRGDVRLDGRSRTQDPAAWRRRVQLVFQDPFASLNPVHRVRHHLERPLVRNGRAIASEGVEKRSLELLDQVGLRPPEEFIDAHPQELSGGQRQRVAIARALAPEPDVLVADEPTSMLDVSLRAGVLRVLTDLVRTRGLALLLVTHDLASARVVADRTLVLFAGELVEEGPTEAVLADPRHPYTRLLRASLPGTGLFDDGATGPPTRAGTPPPAEGCAFAARCPKVVARCRTGPVPLVSLGDARSVRCHLASPTAAVAAGPLPS